MSFLIVVRWIHVIAAAFWLGEVVTVNFVLLPAAIKLVGKERDKFMQNVFPRVYQLASVLAAATILSGILLSYLITGWHNLGQLLTTRWGLSIGIGGLMGLLLTLFHFFIENRFEPAVVDIEKLSQAEIDKITAVMKVVPRVGLGVVTIVLLLMMIAAHGF